MRKVLILACLLWATPAIASHAPIEGFGAPSQGGSGQPECVVTTLAAGGTGSLRDCLAGGNRDIKFSVAGVIQLPDPGGELFVQSNTTVDGFSAPEPGITIQGNALRIWDAKHVIIRNVRIHNVGFIGTTPSNQFGTVTHEIDCVDVQGTSQYVVFDHVSVRNCGDGGIDIKAPAKDVTIQWSIVSTWKTHLWGSTQAAEQPITGRISYHHNAMICNDQGPTPPDPRGCDRMPLIRAAGSDMLVDFRRNIVNGWIRANGTKVEPNARVNVVGNAYIPQPTTSVSDRQSSISVPAGTQVYTAGNVEYPPSGTPVNMNVQGNMGAPHSVPVVTDYEIGCAVVRAGAWPRDAFDTVLLGYAAAVPTACSAPEMPGGGGGGGGGTGGGGGGASMVVNPTNPPVGGTYQVTITGGPGHRADWVGVKPVGAPVSSYIDAPESWNYASDSKLYPATGASAFTVTLTRPSACATPCEVFFASADSFTLVPGFPLVPLGGSTPPQPSTATVTVQETVASQVQVALKIGANRPTVTSIEYRANGSAFHIGQALTATWTRPPAPGPFAFLAVVTYADGSTETVTPTPASVP